MCLRLTDTAPHKRAVRSEILSDVMPPPELKIKVIVKVNTSPWAFDEGLDEGSLVQWKVQQQQSQTL
jgi:hypothetical protein